MLKHAAKEFCANTTLHGYKFLVHPKRLLAERLLWATIILMSVMAATVSSWLAWKEAQTYLIQTVTDSTHHPIWNYPFPAVTICNFNQISKLKVYEMIKQIKRPSDISAEDLALDMRNLVQLTLSGMEHVPQWNLTRLQDVLDQNNIPAHNLLQKLTPSCTDLVQRCKWKGEEKRCEVLFEQIQTAMGFCCSFNYYAVKNHHFSGALANRAPPRARRLTGCGYKTALEVLLNNFPGDYYATDVASYGYRILVHHPYNFPDANMPNMWLSMQEIMFISMCPIKTECSKIVAALPIDQRNCLFRAEKHLHSFRYYTFHNCLAECRANIAFRLCSCIPFYFHNTNGRIMSSIPGVDDESLPKQDVFEDRPNKCNCLPNCEYVDYPIESSAGLLSRVHSINQHSLFGGIKVENQSVVRVFFDDLVATKNTKVLCYYWHTLFALFGGLLSLFTGFSFGSAFELVYFFLIRVTVKAVQRKYFKNKKLKKENENFPERHLKFRDGHKNFVYHTMKKNIATNASTTAQARADLRKHKQKHSPYAFVQ